jgi:catechol 2,3-dioxygenase-like lactoylglutathione lyase family enzyme
MSTTPLNSDAAPAGSDRATVPLRFEVVILPVADYDRAKAFYQGLGWRLDIEFKPDGEHRALQFTPPGSPASIQFGEGGTTTPDAALKSSILVVDDIDAARDELISRGADVSEVWHLEPGKGKVTGRDPEGRSYFSRATFSDPEGNEWDLQEVTERLPGRV